MDKVNKFSKTDIQYIADSILNSRHLVVFTGAGISTASGVSDFRGPDGVWTRRDKGLKPVPMKISWDKVLPNTAHKSITDLQELGLVKAIISQNVDGLHLDSGIKLDTIAEIHGNKNIMKCLGCDSRFSKVDLGWEDRLYGNGYRTSVPLENQPKCPNCRERIISSIINFGDPMPEKETLYSHHHSKLSDVFLVVGSSLVVNPAASYPRIAKKNGAKLIIINQGKTPLDDIADLKLEGDCSVILPAVINLINSHS
ncbi:MAG: Sir2 family NAD-dependent protein deacetylase [Candidatus Kariarchaeaceae archaeon]